MIHSETKQPDSLLPISEKRLYGSPGLANQPDTGLAQLSNLVVYEPESLASLIVSPSESSVLEVSTLSLSSSPISSPSESPESSPLSSRPSTPPPATPREAFPSPAPAASAAAPSILIRPYQEGDLPGLDKIDELSYPAGYEDRDSFLAKLFVGDSFVAIDQNTGSIVAYCIGLPWHKEPCHIDCSPTKEDLIGADVYVVHDVAVHPNCRGGGIASLLLESLLNCGRKRGFSKAVLVAINPTARIVWGKKGFVPMACTSGGGYGPEATKMERFL